MTDSNNPPPGWVIAPDGSVITGLFREYCGAWRRERCQLPSMPRLVAVGGRYAVPEPLRLSLDDIVEERLHRHDRDCDGPYWARSGSGEARHGVFVRLHGTWLVGPFERFVGPFNDRRQAMDWIDDSNRLATSATGGTEHDRR